MPPLCTRHRGDLPGLNTPFMHLFPSVTIELIKLYYYTSKNTIYIQVLIFKIKDAAKINKINDQ